MKSMVESAPLVNGAPSDMEAVHSLKVAVNGEVVQQNGIRLPSPDCSSTSSGDLQLHLPIDSDDEKEQTTKDSSVVASSNDGQPDLENIHDPKSIKLTAKSSGANLLDMYKGSAETSLETSDSANKEVDSYVVESKAYLKLVGACEGTDPNNCDIKDANETGGNSEADETTHVEFSKNSINKNLNCTLSNSANLVEEKASADIVNKCLAEKVVPQAIKEDSVMDCTDAFVKEETLNSESNNTKNPMVTTGDSPHSNCLKQELGETNLLESKATLNVSDKILEENAIDSDSGRESRHIDSDKSTFKSSTDLHNNEDPKVSLVLNSDNGATGLSVSEDCKGNELQTMQNENGESFTENFIEDSNKECGVTEKEAKCEKTFISKEDAEMVSPLIKNENQKTMVQSVSSVSSSVSQDTGTTAELASSEEEKPCLELTNNESSSVLDNDDFELKFELECSDNSQDMNSDPYLKCDKTVSNNLCKREQPTQKTDGEATVSTLVHTAPVSTESDNKVNITGEINNISEVSKCNMPKLSDVESVKNEQNKVEEMEEVSAVEETPVHDSACSDTIKPSAETGPDNAADLLDSKEETIANMSVINDIQKTHSPRANSANRVAVTKLDIGDKTVGSFSVDDTEHSTPNDELVDVKSEEDLCIQHDAIVAATELKMTVNEEKVVKKPEQNTETDSVSDLNDDINETSISPNLEVEEDGDGKAESANHENKSIEHASKQSNNLETYGLEMETPTDAVDDSVTKQDVMLSVSSKSSNDSCDVDTVGEDRTDSCSTNKSDSSSESNETSNRKKSDLTSAFDKLFSDKIKETADESDCTSGKPAFPSDSSDTKENDAPIASQEGMNAVSIDFEDDSGDSIVSSEKDDSRGLSGIAQKRSPPIDSPVESKRPKLTNNHETISTKEVQSQSSSLKRSSELGEITSSKKSRVDSAQVPSTKPSEHVSKKPESSTNIENCSTSSQPSRKSLSNIDKAIERVAFAGLDRKERIMMPFIKDLKHKRLQDITVDDLEELVTQRMAEVLTDSGENGILREKVQKLERMTEFWKHKATSLQKQLSDMTMVFKKLATETKQNSSQLQIPIKITRSVGLQVMMPQTQSGGKSNTHVRNGLPPGTKRKSGGIMTNRNTSPNIHYPSSNTMVPNRPPLVQKVIAPPVPTSTPVKVSQVVPSVKSPVIGTPTPTVRFRSPNTVVSSVISGTVTTTAASNQRILPSVANRPLLKTTPPRPANDMLIDLTDEDDKTKRVATSTALPTTLRLAQFNGTPQTQGGTIRIVSPQQLTSTTTGVNGQRLTYMLPASAANAATGRLQLFTQQTGGNLRAGSVLTVRPNSQTLTLKNGTVLSSTSPTSAIIRTATGGTFQQVVSRPAQIRNIQPANRLPTGPFNRTSAVLTESPVSRPLVPVASGHSQHPAPLPLPPAELPTSPNWKKAPPRPDLKISKVDTRDQHGIILSWNMDHGSEHEEIASYQLYAYQENSGPPLTSLWKKVGDVKAMPLPMACTLTQFLEGNKYHFAVRAVDIHSRCGMFSIPGHIVLPRRVTS